MTTFLVIFFSAYIVTIPLRRALKRKRQAAAQPVYFVLPRGVAAPPLAPAPVKQLPQRQPGYLGWGKIPHVK